MFIDEDPGQPTSVITAPPEGISVPAKTRHPSAARPKGPGSGAAGSAAPQGAFNVQHGLKVGCRCGYIVTLYDTI